MCNYACGSEGSLSRTLNLKGRKRPSNAELLVANEPYYKNSSVVCLVLLSLLFQASTPAHRQRRSAQVTNSTAVTSSSPSVLLRRVGTKSPLRTTNEFDDKAAPVGDVSSTRPLVRAADDEHPGATPFASRKRKRRELLKSTYQPREGIIELTWS